jgi:hypothetical protein
LKLIDFELLWVSVFEKIIEKYGEKLPEEHGGCLHEWMIELFEIGSFIDKLFVLEFIGYIVNEIPRVFSAPATIMIPRMVTLKPVDIDMDDLG